MAPRDVHRVGVKSRSTIVSPSHAYHRHLDSLFTLQAHADADPDATPLTLHPHADGAVEEDNPTGRDDAPRNDHAVIASVPLKLGYGGSGASDEALDSATANPTATQGSLRQCFGAAPIVPVCEGAMASSLAVAASSAPSMTPKWATRRLDGGGRVTGTALAPLRVSFNTTVTELGSTPLATPLTTCGSLLLSRHRPVRRSPLATIVDVASNGDDGSDGRCRSDSGMSVSDLDCCDLSPVDGSDGASVSGNCGNSAGDGVAAFRNSDYVARVKALRGTRNGCEHTGGATAAAP